MLMQIMAVYDSKAEVYNRPFFVEAVGIALRSFMDLLKEGTHDFAKHPEDYTLFHLGSFDNKTAKYDLFATPKSLGVAIEFMPVQTNN